MYIKYQILCSRFFVLGTMSNDDRKCILIFSFSLLGFDQFGLWNSLYGFGILFCRYFFRYLFYIVHIFNRSFFGIKTNISITNNLFFLCENCHCYWLIKCFISIFLRQIWALVVSDAPYCFKIYKMQVEPWSSFTYSMNTRATSFRKQ